MLHPVHRALPLVLGLWAAACQPLDTSAASGSHPAPPPPLPPGGHTVSLDTPVIELPDGGSTPDSCEATHKQALEILATNCAECHGGGSPGARQGQPPFDCVLDVPRMLMMTSATVNDPTTRQPARFLVAGDPEHSRIYVRTRNAEMPPPEVVGIPSSKPRPTVSDLSVLHRWISECIPVSGTPGSGAAGAAAPIPGSQTQR